VNAEREIDKRILEFACRISKMDRALTKERRVNRNAMNQLLDASSGIGSNLAEARGAQSRADFHAKVRIALKEARESHYWLKYLLRSGSVSAKRITALIDEANQIVAILTTIAKKVNPRNPVQTTTS
jgi:four helix bundle protein